MLEIIGWTGAILFSLCALPQAFRCYQEKNGQGLSAIFLGMWAVGEILTLIYTLLLPVIYWPLVLNYIFNLACLLVIIWYSLFPGR